MMMMMIEDGDVPYKPTLQFAKLAKVINVYAAYGQSAAGRYLVIFYIRKITGALLPISARDMDAAERKYYGKQKK